MIFIILIIILIIIIITTIFICKNDYFSSIKNEQNHVCNYPLICPPGYKNCINTGPPSPSPPGPGPGPGPSGHNFLTKLVNDLKKMSILNTDPTNKYSDLSGVIIIEPDDDIKTKLQFMLDEWNQLTIPLPYYVDGEVNEAIQNAVYPYNTNTKYYDGKNNRQSYNKPYTIIFLPDLSKENTTYKINDHDGTNLINLFYFSSIYSLQTDTNRVTLVGNIGPNYIPDNPDDVEACGPKSDGDKIPGRKRCGPWSAYVQTGQYLKTNSADNVFFKSINNIDIKINDKESPHNSLIWNTSQMCPIRNVNLYAGSYTNYGSIELGGGVGGWLSDSTIENIYVSAMGQWMASQENYCFKNLKFNKLGGWRGHTDAANIGQPGTAEIDHSDNLSKFDGYKKGATSNAYKTRYEDSSTGGITPNPNACWTRYGTKVPQAATSMSDGCPGQFNFCFLNCKNQNDGKIDDNFLTKGGQRICDASEDKNKNFYIQSQGFNGATRTNSPNVVENNPDNNYNKPCITGSGIICRGKTYTNYKIISNDSDFATFFTEDGQIENTIYILLSNIYNFNNEEYESILSFEINKNGITLLGLGFSIIKCKNTDNGIKISNNNVTLTNLIFDCPDIQKGENLQNSVINIYGDYCEIYDVTVRTVLRCPNMQKSSISEPYPYLSTEENCLPSNIKDQIKTTNIIPVGAASMILVNGKSCYIENIWLWRGDHLDWGGFDKPNQKALDSFNICPFGIIITSKGEKCEIVQASIEHHSLSSVLWLGESGKTLAVQGEVAYYNFGSIDLIGQDNLNSSFRNLFLPSQIDNFGDVPTQKINWNYGIWEDYGFTFPSPSSEKSSLSMRDNFGDISTKEILREISHTDKTYILENIFNQTLGVYYIIIGDHHICNGAGFYSLFKLDHDGKNSKRYPLYIKSDLTNITVKNTYITGWALYKGTTSNTMWDAIYGTDKNSSVGPSVQLGDAVYLCNLNPLGSLTMAQQKLTRKEIVDNASKGNASLIPLSEIPQAIFSSNLEIGL